MSPAFLLPLLFLIPPEPQPALPEVKDPRVAMVEELERVLLRIGKDAEGWQWDIAGLYADLGQEELALAAMKRWEPSGKHPEVYMRLATALTQKGLISSAFRMTEKAIHEVGTSPDPYWNQLASALLEVKKIPEAKKAARRIKDPVLQAYALLNIASTLVEQKDQVWRAEIAKEALASVNRMKPPLDRQGLSVLSTACIDSGDLEQGMLHLRRLREMPKEELSWDDHLSFPLSSLVSGGEFPLAFDFAIELQTEEGDEFSRDIHLWSICSQQMNLHGSPEMLSLLTKYEIKEGSWCEMVLEDVISTETCNGNFFRAKQLIAWLPNQNSQFGCFLFLVESFHKSGRTGDRDEMLDRLKEISVKLPREYTSRYWGSTHPERLVHLSQEHSRFGNLQKGRELLAEATHLAPPENSSDIGYLTAVSNALLLLGKRDEARKLIDLLWEKGMQELIASEPGRTARADIYLWQSTASLVQLGEIETAVTRATDLNIAKTTLRNYLHVIADQQARLEGTDTLPPWLKAMPDTREKAYQMQVFIRAFLQQQQIRQDVSAYMNMCKLR